MSEQRVEREATFEASPEEVWEALTDERLLAEWLADEAELDPEPGGAVSFRVGDERRDGRVEQVEEGRRLAFTWSRDGEGPSLVEFRIVPAVAGTRLIVTERALTGPVATAARADWHGALSRLARALELVLALA
jgi:uncharacterized protein YndB with AHSA1/START domain